MRPIGQVLLSPCCGRRACAEVLRFGVVTSLYVLGETAAAVWWVRCGWRGFMMALGGEAVAAEVVGTGRLDWTLGLGKTRGKVGANVFNRLGNSSGAARRQHAASIL